MDNDSDEDDKEENIRKSGKGEAEEIKATQFRYIKKMTIHVTLQGVDMNNECYGDRGNKPEKKRLNPLLMWRATHYNVSLI